MFRFLKKCMRPSEEHVRREFETRELKDPQGLAKHFTEQNNILQGGFFADVFRSSCENDDLSGDFSLLDDWNVQPVRNALLNYAENIIGKTARKDG